MDQSFFYVSGSGACNILLQVCFFQKKSRNNQKNYFLLYRVDAKCPLYESILFSIALNLIRKGEKNEKLFQKHL